MRYVVKGNVVCRLSKNLATCHRIIDRYFLYVIMKALIQTHFWNYWDTQEIA